MLRLLIVACLSYIGTYTYQEENKVDQYIKIYRNEGEIGQVGRTMLLLLESCRGLTKDLKINTLQQLQVHNIGAIR